MIIMCFKSQEEQLQSSEREKHTVRQQLMRKVAELTRAIRREQQQIQEMRQRVSLVCVCVSLDYDVTILYVSLATGE